MVNFGDLIPKELKANISGKTVKEIEKEEEERKKKQKQEERFKNLSIKYGTMFEEIYKKFSYKNDKGEYDSRYFRELPEKIVEKFVKLQKEKKSKLTSTKLRQYYDIVNGLYKSNIEGEKLRSELYIMLAKANYDLGRKNIVPQEFVDFLKINIDMVFDGGYSKEKFTVFKRHFEAVVAYAKGQIND